METISISFKANGQTLEGSCPFLMASNTVNYIVANFELDDNWGSFDSVRAVWHTDSECISTVLDNNGECYVPQEVLKRKDSVFVNLVGSVVEDDVLTDRLTSYPVEALKVNATALICGTETAEITPSQFEQFVSIVIAEVEKVTGMTAVAVPLPEGSDPTASYEDGVLTLGIPKGEKGDTGNGIERVEFNSDYSLTFYFTESEPYTTPSIRGERGAQGYGIVDVEKIGSVGLIDTYQVNYENPEVEPTTFEITNGAKGDTGNGIESAVLNDDYTLTLTFTDGTEYTTPPIRGAKGDTGNGIDRIELTDTQGSVKTYTIYFTDGTTTTFEVTDGEVTLAQLSTVLPTDTASGAIASFTDGSDLFDYLSCIVNIDPVQDLHGYDKPWVGGVGANKITPKNVSRTINGVSVVASASSETITVNGTATDNGGRTNKLTDDFTLPAGTYYFMAFGKVSAGVALNNASDSVVKWANNSFTLTEETSVYVGVNVTSGTTYNETIRLSLVSGSTAPALWTPWENLCPITGWTGCEVVQASRNLFNGSYDVMYKLPEPIPKGTWVTASAKTSGNTQIYYYDENQAQIDYFTLNQTDPNDSSRRYRTFQMSKYEVQAVPYYIKFTSVSATDMQFELSSEDAPPTAYKTPTLYNITWQTEAGSVYGGTVDLVTGVLTAKEIKITENEILSVSLGGTVDANKKRAYIQVQDQPKNVDATAVGNIKCNILPSLTANATYLKTEGISYAGTAKGVYAYMENLQTIADWTAFISANNMEFTYELATPQTYQLDPVQVACLLGQNNVWANCGDIEEVKYKADVQLWVEKKLGE